MTNKWGVLVGNGLVALALIIGSLGAVLGVAHHPTWFVLMGVFLVFHEAGFVLGGIAYLIAVYFFG